MILDGNKRVVLGHDRFYRVVYFYVEIFSVISISKCNVSKYAAQVC